MFSNAMLEFKDVQVSNWNLQFHFNSFSFAFPEKRKSENLHKSLFTQKIESEQTRNHFQYFVAVEQNIQYINKNLKIQNAQNALEIWHKIPA